MSETRHLALYCFGTREEGEPVKPPLANPVGARPAAGEPAAPAYRSAELGFWGEPPALRLAMLLHLCHTALDSYKIR